MCIARKEKQSKKKKKKRAKQIPGHEAYSKKLITEHQEQADI